MTCASSNRFGVLAWLLAMLLSGIGCMGPTDPKRQLSNDLGTNSMEHVIGWARDLMAQGREGEIPAEDRPRGLGRDVLIFASIVGQTNHGDRRLMLAFFGGRQIRELIILAPESAWYPGNGIRLTNGVYLVVQNNGLLVPDRIAAFPGNGPIL
jgi:hypothetical protein